MGSTTKSKQQDTIPAVTLFPAMPEFVTIEAKVAGMADFGKIKMPLTINQENGNPFYSGGRRRGVKLPTVATTEEIAAVSDDTIRKVLASLEARLEDGTKLNLGEVHTSKPRKKKDGTTYGGGNLTVSATISTIVMDGETARPYTAWLYLTWLGTSLDSKGNPKLFSLTGKLTNQARSGGDPLVGEMEGFEF